MASGQSGQSSVGSFPSLAEQPASLGDAAAVGLVQMRPLAALRGFLSPAEHRAEPAGQVGLAQQLPEALHHVDVVFGG